MRKLSRRTTFATQDILRLIRDNDLSDCDTFLVLNGGTGIGKTTSIMTEVQHELEKKLNSRQSMLIVESRTATVSQINTKYVDTIESFGGIDVCQRLGLMHLINKNQVNYDWVVIDECHGLFSEASFAEDAESIANWIKNGRANTHIIFITANDEYFDELSRQYFPNDYNFIYLFPDFTQYYSNTYVKEIQFFKTTKSRDIINILLTKLQGQRGIVFLKRASAVKDNFFELLRRGVQVGMIVSQANETPAALTTYQQKQAQNALIDISDGQAGLMMADLCELVDTMRHTQGLRGVREAINEEELPEDIEVLFATDTIQEGISIKTPIDYIIIEGYTEVEVRQKLGRFRGNLGQLYIVFNTASARFQTEDKIKIFKQLQEAYEAGNQTELAEFYGRQQASKSTISFLKKRIDKETGTVTYFPNTPAYLNYLREYELYLQLMNDTTTTVLNTYTYPLLEGAPKIVEFNELKEEEIKTAVLSIADKWRGIPLKGPAQEELIEDFNSYGITDNLGRNKSIDSFKKCCSIFNKYAVILKEKQASKTDLNNWPQYLTKAREKFKIII